MQCDLCCGFTRVASEGDTMRLRCINLAFGLFDSIDVPLPCELLLAMLSAAGGGETIGGGIERIGSDTVDSADTAEHATGGADAARGGDGTGV